MGTHGRRGELVNGLTAWLTDWRTGPAFLVRKGDAEGSSEEQRNLLVVWSYGDTWGESWDWRYGRQWLLAAVECRWTYQDMREFIQMTESRSTWVCARPGVVRVMQQSSCACMWGDKLGLVRSVAARTRGSLSIRMNDAHLQDADRPQSYRVSGVTVKLVSLAKQ